MKNKGSFDFYFFLRSEMAPRVLHAGGREKGDLTPEACDFLVAIIHDWLWPQMFGDFISNNALKDLTTWVEGLLLDSYEPSTDMNHILNLLRILNAHRQHRNYFYDADLLSLFNVNQDKHIGITDLYGIPTIVPKYKHVNYIVTTETNIIDRALCDIYDIPIACPGDRQDIILSHLSNNPAILLSQIEDLADATLVQVGKNDLIVDMEGIKSIQNKSREVIQIGDKNDPSSFNFYLIKSYTSTSGLALTLSFYSSLSEYASSDCRGRWEFRTLDNPKKERLKPRVETYDIEELFSLFPSDYMPFCHERSFAIQGIAIGGKKKDVIPPGHFPIYIINSNMDDVMFLNGQQEYLKFTEQKNNLNKVIFYVKGNVKIVPPNDRTLDRVLLKAILLLLYSTPDLEKRCYWIPFTRYEGAVNVITKDEAKYRLEGWLTKYKPEIETEWMEYCSTKVNIIEETTYYDNAYLHLKMNYDLEDKFPFVKDKKALTDLRMNLVGWSQFGNKGVIESRKQPIRNLMLAALGISREQYKYIKKLSQKPV